MWNIEMSNFMFIAVSMFTCGALWFIRLALKRELTVFQYMKLLIKCLLEFLLMLVH